jgi:putative mRNA 3-end processing factor
MPAHEDLVVMRPEGLYCPAGDFHIDPWRAVERALITHAHSDHARRGHGRYICAAPGAGLLRARLGAIDVMGLPYGEKLAVGGVTIRWHPAGHVLGSAQLRIEHRGAVWVVTGDYFVSGHANDANPTCSAFEPVACDCLVTESTFALPLYRWQPQRETFAAIGRWWQACADAGQTAVLLGYSLGKAQHLLAGLQAFADAAVGPIFVHPAVQAINDAYAAEGVTLPAAQALLPHTKLPARSLVIAPPGSSLPALRAACTAMASGWMALAQGRRRRGAAGRAVRGFVLSDHADWPGLQAAVAASGAERVIVMHGFADEWVRHLAGRRLEAGTFDTRERAPPAPT